MIKNNKKSMKKNCSKIASVEVQMSSRQGGTNSQTEKIVKYANKQTNKQTKK